MPSVLDSETKQPVASNKKARVQKLDESESGSARRLSNSDLEKAVHSVSSVIFDLLTDEEAVTLARALCVPNLLVSKGYGYKRTISMSKILKKGIEKASELAGGCRITSVYTRATVDLSPEQLAALPHLKELIVHLAVYRCPHPSTFAFRHLPDSITKLRLKLLTFPAPSPDAVRFPASLTELILDSFFHPFDKFEFPSTLRRLIINEEAKMHIGTRALPHKLPPSLTYLSTYSVPFSNLRSGVNLTYLRTNHLLQPGDSYPANLQTLILPALDDFHPSMKDPVEAIESMSLPDSLTTLVLPYSYRQLPFASSSSWRWPRALKRLQLASDYTHALEHLPSSQTWLSLPYPLDRLPPHLTYLYIGPGFNKPIAPLPASLRHLHLAPHVNQPIEQVPEGLEVLTVGSAFQQPLEHLPKSVRVVVTDEDETVLQFQDNLPSLDNEGEPYGGEWEEDKYMDKTRAEHDQECINDAEQEMSTMEQPELYEYEPDTWDEDDDEVVAEPEGEGEGEGEGGAGSGEAEEGEAGDEADGEGEEQD